MRLLNDVILAKDGIHSAADSRLRENDGLGCAWNKLVPFGSGFFLMACNY